MPDFDTKTKMSETPTDLAPIIYEPQQQADGILFRYDTYSVIDQLVTLGRQVFITKKVRYPILYRAFLRYAKKNKAKVAGKRLAMAQVNTEKWAIILRSKKVKERPVVEPEEGFKRKHGRYKNWAIELQEGGVWQSPDLKEVSKVMAAWRLYIPRATKRNMRLTRRRMGTLWSIFVVPKAG